MPSATLSELDSLFHQLRRRMVESGEWDRYGPFAPRCRSIPSVNHYRIRILLQLRYQLRDAGWLDSTRAQMLGVSLLSPGFLGSTLLTVTYDRTRI